MSVLNHPLVPSVEVELKILVKKEVKEEVKGGYKEKVVVRMQRYLLVLSPNAPNILKKRGKKMAA